MFLLICRLGFWRTLIGAPDPYLAYMGPPLNRISLEGLSAYHARDRDPVAAISPDALDHEIPKLTMDPVGHTRWVHALPTGLEVERLDESAFGTNGTVARGVIRDSESCCRA